MSRLTRLFRPTGWLTLVQVPPPGALKAAVENAKQQVEEVWPL